MKNRDENSNVDGFESEPNMESPIRTPQHKSRYEAEEQEEKAISLITYD